MRRFIETGARVIVGVLFGTLAFVVGVALADTLTVPFKIKAPGQTIFAGHWQSNFQAIEDVVNAHIDDANIENAGITGSTKLIDELRRPGDPGVLDVRIVNVGVDDVLDRLEVRLPVPGEDRLPRGLDLERDSERIGEGDADHERQRPEQHPDDDPCPGLDETAHLNLRCGSDAPPPGARRIRDAL